MKVRDADIDFELARSYVNAGLIDRAEPLFLRAREEGEPTAEVTVELANLALKRGDPRPPPASSARDSMPCAPRERPRTPSAPSRGGRGSTASWATRSTRAPIATPRGLPGAGRSSAGSG